MEWLSIPRLIWRGLCVLASLISVVRGFTWLLDQLDDINPE